MKLLKRLPLTNFFIITAILTGCSTTMLSTTESSWITMAIDGAQHLHMVGYELVTLLLKK